MAEIYDYHKRIQSESWLIVHIETLIKEAKANSNSSFVLYAALEIRNLIEKISYDIILLSTDTNKWSEIEKSAKIIHGIDNVNDTYKTLNYKFQTFSEAISKLADLPAKVFDYNKSDLLKKKLGEYVHIYTKKQTDLNFGSEFIKNGILIIEESLDFIKNYFTKKDNFYEYAILKISTLPDEYKSEF
jgi:hypothetical protein